MYIYNIKIAAVYQDRAKEESSYSSHCQCREEITLENRIVKLPLQSAMWLRPTLGHDLLLLVQIHEKNNRCLKH